MSSAKFCKLLEELEYRPNAAVTAAAAAKTNGRASIKGRALAPAPAAKTTLSPDAVDWMFVVEDSTKPFLAWLCNNVTKSNYVAEEDAQRFQALKDDDKIIENPQDLQIALKQAGKTKSEDEEIDDLRAEIAFMESQLTKSREELKELVWQRDLMQGQVRATQARVADVKKLIKQRDDDFGKSTLQKIDQSNAMLNSALQGVVEAASTIVKTISPLEGSVIVSPQAGGKDAAFLFASSLEPFYTAEEDLSKLMRVYVERNVGSSDDQGANRQQLAGALAWMNGVSAETHARQCKELARLQAFYPTYEMERIRAELNVTKKRAAVENAKSQLMKHHQKFLATSDMSPTESQQRLAELKKQLVTARASNNKVVDVTIVGLVNELAKLQSTPILWGDHNLKLARQHFNVYKQNKAISNLMSQIARQTVLSFAATRERKELADAYTLIASLVKEVDSVNTSYQSRMKTLAKATVQGVATSASQSEQMSLDPSNLLYFEDLQATRQVLIELLKRLVPAGSEVSTKETGLLTVVVRLQELTDASNRKSAIQSQTLESRIAKAAESVESLKQALFADATTQTPDLSPLVVVEANRNLEKALTTLTSAMETLIKDHQIKSKKLASAPREKQLERNLFSYFFSDSENLKSLIRELERRVAASQVKAK